MPVRGVTRETALRAAADVLAAYGLSASMNAIAKRAGLSKMTRYRHFESKEDLLLAVMADHYDRLRAIAENVDRIDEYLERAILQIGPDRGYFHVAMMAGGANEAIKASAAALDEVVGRRLARAQAEGTIRDDIVAGDLHSLMLGLSSQFADDWRRSLALALDALAGGPALDEPPMQLADYARFQAERARRLRADTGDE